MPSVNVSLTGITAATDSGTKGDLITNYSSPVFYGTADVGDSVEIINSNNNNIIGSTVVDSSGTFNITPVSAFADGTYSVYAQAFATVEISPGNFSITGAQTPNQLITIDTTPPIAPTKPALSAASDSGSVGDNVTNVNHPVFTGTAEPNSFISVYDGSTLVGTTSANSSGAWFLPPSATLIDGVHNITAKATDRAGNVSPTSASLSMYVDTVAPFKPTITGISTATDSGVLGDNITRNTHPYINGMGEPNTTLSLYDGSTLIGTTTVSFSGNWGIYPMSSLSDGVHNITAQSSDQAGNLSLVSNTYALTIDTIAPSAPLVTGIIAASDSGALGDNLTNQATPGISGTGDPYSGIVVYDNNAVIGTTTVSSSGVWVFIPTNPLSNGAHSINVISFDNAGNSSPASYTYTFLIDTVAPAAPVVSGITAATDSGSSNSDGITSNSNPTFIGTAEANSVVKVYDGSTLIGTTTANSSGNWNLTPTNQFTDGTHSIKATSTDAAANVSPASSSYTLTIDRIAPAAPVISGITAATDSGLVGDGVTNRNNVILAGTAEAGSSVQVYEGYIFLGTTSANSSGAWTFATSFGDGLHQLQALAVDAAGNTSSLSNNYALTIDTISPFFPNISGITAATDSGTVGDGITNNNIPTLVGTAESNSTVTVYDGSTLIGTTIANGFGNWTLTPASLSDGTHDIAATSTDRAGNVSLLSFPYNLTIDTVAPSAPIVSGIASAIDSGTVGDGVTNYNKPVFTGTAEANSTINLYDAANLIGTTVANNSGVWTLTTNTLSDGVHNVTATSTDQAGNISIASSNFTLTIDTAAPAAPFISGITATTDSGVVGDGITNYNKPAFTGTAEANSTVKVYDGGTLIGTTATNGSGNWTYIPTTALTDGVHNVTATSTDQAANVSITSLAQILTVDTVAPVSPLVSGITAATDSATVGDGVTNNNEPVITGNAEVNSVINIYDNGTLLGTTMANASGVWTFTPTTALADGSHNITGTSTDQAGNVSIVSPTFALNVDTIAPIAPIIMGITAGTDSGTVGDGLTNNIYPTIVGFTEANSTVTVYDGSTVLGSVSANALGAWSYTTPSLLDGVHTFNARSTDQAGNVSTVSNSYSLTVDTVAPSVPSVTGIASITDGGIVGDGITNYNKPLITGNAEANSTIKVYDGFTLVGTTTVDNSGNWILLPSSSFVDGVHNLDARSTDQAGNASALSNFYNLTIDTVVPAAPVVSGITAVTDSGVVGDGITNNTDPTLMGTAEANSTVKVYDGALLVGSASVDNSGNWSVTPLSVLNNGIHAFAATSTDVAGNISVLSKALDITINNVQPTQPGIPLLAFGSDSGLVGDSVTNVAKPILSGSSDPGTTIQVHDGKILIAQANTDAAGNWSATSNQALSDGLHSIIVVAKDSAGNTSKPSTPLNLVIDQTPPLPPTVQGIFKEGSLVDRTNNTQPLFKGQAEAGSTVGIYIDGTLSGSVQADQTGQWTYEDQQLTNDGIHTLVAQATDQAGNGSGLSASFQFTVDTQASSVVGITISVQSYGDSVGTGSTVSFTVQTDKPVTVNTSNGIPTLDLNNGDQAIYSGMQDSTHLTFILNIDPNAVTNNLKVVGLQSNGSSITDGDGNQTGLSNASSVAGSSTGIVVGDPVASGGTGPVFRFFNESDGSHFYTLSSTEKATIQATRPDMVYEGKSFGSVDRTDPNATGVFRFFDTKDGSHFFTTDSDEKNTLMQTRSDLTYEGANFYEHATQQAGDIAVYRFFNETNGSHLFTSDQDEKVSVQSMPQYKFEGVAFWTPNP